MSAPRAIVRRVTVRADGPGGPAPRTGYRVSCLPEDHPDIHHWTIAVVPRGRGTWAVTWAGECLSADGEWVHEPAPSARTDAWLARHRFDEATALRLARRHAPLIRVNGLTAAEVLAPPPRSPGPGATPPGLPPRPAARHATRPRGATRNGCG